MSWRQSKVCTWAYWSTQPELIPVSMLHKVTRSITTPPWMGHWSIARYPSSLSSGFPENSPIPIYIPGVLLLDGTRSPLQGYPPSISSGFPENSPIPIYTPGVLLLDGTLVHCKVTRPAFHQASLKIHPYPFILLGPVVQRLISTNPGLNCNPAFFISLFKSILGKIFTILFRTSNDQIASKNIWTEFSLKVFRPEIKFHTNPGLS